MSTYVLAFRGRTDRAVDAEQEAAWGRWFREIDGSVVDHGHRVGQVRAVGGGAGATDGQEALAGYITVKAEDIDSAVKIASGCPGLRHGVRVEVGEAVEM